MAAFQPFDNRSLKTLQIRANVIKIKQKLQGNVHEIVCGCQFVQMQYELGCLRLQQAIQKVMNIW
jgi:hypothetical protein